MALIPRRAAALLVAIAAAVWSTQAPAQPAEEEQAAAAARSQALYDQANELLDRGRYGEAVTAAEAHLAGGDPGDTGPTPRLLAIAYNRHGDFLRAESVLLRTIAFHERSDGLPSEEAVFMRHLLGRVYLSLGDDAAAEQLLSRAHAVESYPFAALVTLEAMIELSLERGEHQRARELLAQLRSIRELSFSGQVLLDEVPERTLGEIALRKGDTAAAEPLLRKALESVNAWLDPEHPHRARILDDLGVLLTRKRAHAEAEARLSQALAIRERHLAAHHPDTARTLGHLADLRVEQGDVEGAVRTRERAAAVWDQGARAYLAGGSERRKLAFMGLVNEDTDAVVSLHARAAPRSRAAARLALATILRRKGLVLDAVAGALSTLRRRLDPGSRALFDGLAAVDAELSGMLSRGPVDVPPEEYRAEIDALEGRRRAIEAGLAARTRDLAAGPGADAPVTVDRVQAAIPEGAALVELVQYRPHHPFGPPVKATWGKPRYAAYVLRRQGEVASVDLGDAGVIDRIARGLVADLSTTRRDPRPAARQLDSLVMQPIRALIDRGAGGAARWILLSPDGALHLVPFGALVDEDGRYLIQRTSFTYLTSGRDLLRLAERSPEARRGALILANPEFGALGDDPPTAGAGAARRSVDMAALRFQPLPGTEAEGREVSRALPGATLLTRGAATEEALKAAPGPRVLHIASHGFFLPDLPGDAGAGGQVESPLLRAGIALAGANRRQSATEAEDGVLTALEISGLDLRGTRLVVLSACETGVGEATRGEGVYGLRRALVMAGAEAQVMSLWSVDDEATEALMAAYYRGLAAGGGRSEALRQAQLAMLASGERVHPYTWASFIVSGNGAALDGRQVAPGLAPPRGPRGCACTAAGRGAGDAPVIAAIAVWLCVTARRRGSRRRWIEN